MSLYDMTKAKTYASLAVCGFDHNLAKSKGFKDGWDMLIQSHNDNGYAMFMGLLMKDEPSQAKRRILLDGLATEYTQHKCYLDYVGAACE